MNKNTNKKNLKIGEIIILQLVEMDKDNKKYSFSNLLIDEKFDKKIIINQINDEMLKKPKKIWKYIKIFKI